MQPCGHLLGKDWPLGSVVCDVFLCFVTFQCGVLGHVWYLFVSIPDLLIFAFFLAMFDRYYCIRSFLSLENFEKHFEQISFLLL